MIRFSAALVAVAIGVLIGGIATSKLLLVYVAIVVSAVALVALAIGVVLKREELFGEERGLVPANAGASPVLQATTVGARGGDGQEQARQGVREARPAAPFPEPAPSAAGPRRPRGGHPGRTHLRPGTSMGNQALARSVGTPAGPVGPAGLACRRPGQPSGLAARSAGRSPTRSRGCDGVVRCGTGRCGATRCEASRIRSADRNRDAGRRVTAEGVICRSRRLERARAGRCRPCASGPGMAGRQSRCGNESRRGNEPRCRSDFWCGTASWRGNEFWRGTGVVPAELVRPTRRTVERRRFLRFR